MIYSIVECKKNNYHVMDGFPTMVRKHQPWLHYARPYLLLSMPNYIGLVKGTNKIGSYQPD